jgi:hypothetical protein
MEPTCGCLIVAVFLFSFSESVEGSVAVLGLWLVVWLRLLRDWPRWRDGVEGQRQERSLQGEIKWTEQACVSTFQLYKSGSSSMRWPSCWRLCFVYFHLSVVRTHSFDSASHPTFLPCFFRFSLTNFVRNQHGNQTFPQKDVAKDPSSVNDKVAPNPRYPLWHQSSQ